MKLDIYAEPHQVVEVGDVVATTTSEFEFDMVGHYYCRETQWVVTAEVEKVGEDYSDYDERKSTNGGKYGYTYFKVLSIIDER